jgi:cysteine synthase A
MQGWSPDFIPKLTNDARDAGQIDGVVGVNGAEAMRLSRELARREGIFCGISAGATLAGALEVCKKLPEGANVLFMVPDTGERYLSTPLFEDIPETMTEEEQAIAASTPGYTIGAPAPAPEPTAEPAPVAARIPEPSAKGRAYLDAATGDPDNPVVLFALEWCEFCWAVRKFFNQAGIPFRSIDLDSAAFEAPDLVGDIRGALHARCKTPTIPQIFVNGRHVGGCTETFDAFRDGVLQNMLGDAGVAFNRQAAFDPYEQLPKWVHPR